MCLSPCVLERQFSFLIQQACAPENRLTPLLNEEVTQWTVSCGEEEALKVVFNIYILESVNPLSSRTIKYSWFYRIQCKYIAVSISIHYTNIYIYYTVTLLKIMALFLLWPKFLDKHKKTWPALWDDLSQKFIFVKKKAIISICWQYTTLETWVKLSFYSRL